TRRHKQRSFLLEYLRRPPLQPVHRRVFPVDVVSNLSVGHRAPHRLRRLRHRVAAQVDRIHIRYLSLKIHRNGSHWPQTPSLDNTCAVDIHANPMHSSSQSPAKHNPFSPEAVDPLPCFHAWFAEARALEPNDPDAMALATATPQALPSVRMV